MEREYKEFYMISRMDDDRDFAMPEHYVTIKDAIEAAKFCGMLSQGPTYILRTIGWVSYPKNNLEFKRRWR